MLELTPWNRPVEARVTVPGDKSLTHRGILMSALAHGSMELLQWLDAGDTRSSLRLVRAWGVQVVEDAPGRLVLRRPDSLHEPQDVVDCGNSGTTMRLGSGVASAVSGLTILRGDDSLSRRPMARVIEPLQEMGLGILARQGGVAPLAIGGGPHRGGAFSLPVASAQVKSALLLAGLSAEGSVSVEEPIPTRDHTERLIEAMGGMVVTRGRTVTVEPQRLEAISFTVPGDPSSAAFWGAIAALRPHRRVTIESLLFSASRTGFFRALEKMGAALEWRPAGTVPEPWGSVAVEGRGLSAISVGADDIPSMIDEVPLLALLATQAEGVTEIRGAQELRVKESDRLRVTTRILRAMGAQLEELDDGWIIEGPAPLHGAQVDAEDDHRMAMLAAVAATVAESATQLVGEESVQISYPGFFNRYHQVRNA